MKVTLLVAGLLLVLSGRADAQVDTGTSWADFGPDRGNGAFVNITRRHLTTQFAQGIAVDPQQRVLVLNEWDELSDIDTDCAVTRHIKNARLLDMDYTGPEELEGTRKIAMNMGGTNVDTCSAIASDSQSRAVVVGGGDYGGNASGFVVRLNASGFYDTSFSSDGKYALKNNSSFAGVSSRLNAVAVDSNNRVVACGHVTRGSDRHMIAMRFTATGAPDSSFGSLGIVEPTFAHAGDAADLCERLIILPDQRIALAGTAIDILGTKSFAVVVLTSSGTLDTSFSGDGKAFISTPASTVNATTVADIRFDPPRNRLVFAGNVNYDLNLAPAGFVAALSTTGALDTSFDGDGKKIVRYSDFGSGSANPRAFGETRLRRMLLRDDGAMYLLGTHYNNTSDQDAFGASDVATLRVEADGSVVTAIIGNNTYGDRGVKFHAFSQVRHANFGNQPNGYAASQDRFANERMVDATWYRGNLLLLADRPRYWDTVFDHDGDGIRDEAGPDAPLVANINTERLFGEDFDFDGIDAATPTLTPVIPVPFGYGNYCSVSNPSSSSNFGLAAQGAGSDPCQQFLDGNPNLVIERSGIYSLSGINRVIGACSGNFTILFEGIGTTPIDQAFAASSGRNGCVFTVVPSRLVIFSRPYTGAHVAYGQAFNHDPYNIPLDVSQFGQTPGTYDACYIDNRGQQRSTGNPHANPSTCKSTGGVDEPAVDIIIDSSRSTVAMAPGWVVMAVPRHIPLFSPAGNDPYQREVFVRHRVGTGRYQELFTAYYAHMQDTPVRRGSAVNAGTVLGQIGTTGASSGEHLHISVHRNRNLSYRKTFEFNFSGGAWDRDGSVSSIDPWNWSAPQGVDPWAWRFRIAPPDSPELGSAGSFSSWMWLSGEDPTLNY